LVIDALALSRTKAPDSGGCRFCGVLVRALDLFFEDWRKIRERVYVDLREKGSIKVGLDQEKRKGQAVEIYSAPGRKNSLYLAPNLLFPLANNLRCETIRLPS
jgi:hypothetical protein